MIFHPKMRLLPSMLLGKLKAANRRLLAAIGCYIVLTLIAAFALDGFLRAAVLFYFVILAIRTIAHSNDEKME